MIRIPLVQEPSQTLAMTLAGQPTQIALRTNGGHLYFDLLLDDQPIITGRVCRNRMRMLTGFEYRGYVGDFMFIDTQGDADPFFLDLNTRYQLMYLEDGE